MVSDARDAYRAGISGARSYPGNPDSFRRGRKSSVDFRRNRRFNKPKRKAPSNRWDRKLGSFIKDKASSGIGAFGTAVKAADELLFTPMRKASQNKKLMGDLYKDKEYRDNVKKSLMTGFGLRKGQEGYEGSDQQFYDKYTMLAGLASDNAEKQRLQGIADSAFRNAQISSRLNYGLGTLGFDTIGKEPFESYTKPMFGESTSRFNQENFMSGIESTPTGKAFMAEAMKAKANDDGKSMIGDALKNYGNRDVLLDMNVPVQDKFLEQFDIAEALTPLQKHLLQSQAQGRGGYDEDSEQAMINAGFDMDYIGPRTRMAISRYP